MWLILVGLTLLAGDALSQANKVINSETDLLALESDQLIHSSAELLALEDQNKFLPFGARLPGYGRPLFAYSYTVKDAENVHNTKNLFRDEQLTSLHNSPIDHISQSSENVIYLHDLDIFKQNIKDFSDENKTDDQNNATDTTHIPQNSENDSKFIKLVTKNEQVRSDIDRNDSILNTQHLLSSYLPPLHTKNEVKIPTFDYLPPKEEKTSSQVEIKHANKFLDQENILATNEQSLIPKITLDYLPPEPLKPLTPVLDQSYLPPVEQKLVPAATSNFITPESLLETKTDSSEEALLDSLNINYLPPEKSTHELNIDLSYLPPEKKDEIIDSPVNNQPVETSEGSASNTFAESYLPPQENINTNPGLNLGYLPPEMKDKSTVNKEFSPVKPNLEYLPPVEDKTNEKIFTLSKESLSPIIPIGISRTIQPPSIPFFSNTFSKPILTENSDKVPPGIASVSVLLPPIPDFDKKPIFDNENVKDITLRGTIGQKHTAPIQNFPIGIKRIENKQILDSVIENVKDQPIHPVAEQYELLPPDVELQPPNKKEQKVSAPSANVEITPHIDLKSNQHLKEKVFETSGSFENPPIGIKRKVNKIKPDVITEEISDEPIRPTSEVRENPLYAIFFEHKNEPVRVLKDNEKIMPTAVFSDKRNDGLTEVRKHIKKPEVSYSEIFNEPLQPISTYNKIPSAEAKEQISYQEIPAKVSSLVVSDFSIKSNNEQSIQPKKIITPVTIGVESRSTLEYRKEINEPPLADYKKKIPDPKIIPQSHSDKHFLPVIYESNDKDFPLSDLGYKSNIEQPIYHKKILTPVTIEAEHKPTLEYRKEIKKAPIAVYKRKILDQKIIPQSHYDKHVLPVVYESKEENTRPFDLGYKSNIEQTIYPEKIIAPVTIRVESKPISEYEAPLPVYKKKIPDPKITPQSHFDRHLLPVVYEIKDEKIRPSSTVKSNQNHIIQSKSPFECLTNAECDEEDVCQDGRCIFGCSLAIDLCVGEASCETRHHVPACVCPLMSTARTLYNSGYLQFDCVPMVIPASSKIISEYSQERLPSRFNTFSYQRPIVAPVRSTSTFVQSPISHTDVRGGAIRGSGNPCSPSPCGPNTRCDVNSNGIAQCRCIEDYVPDGHTINGCKPQCSSDNECPDDYECQSSKCLRLCKPGACGLYADCDARNHRITCSCPPSYGGDPYERCERNLPEVRAPPDLPVDPCVPNPCGTNADCRERGDRAVCSCPIGYEGNPLTNCIKGECVGHNDCPNHLACKMLRCIDPCVGVCGSSSECAVREHQPVCSCPRNHIGDPFTNCRRITEYDVCNPTPCGQNTNCKAKHERDGGLRAVCSCIDNYIGSPLTGCRAECTRDTDCNANQHCSENRCRNPCVRGCGEGAYCDVRNHQAVCTCPEYFLGDAHTRCYPECTAHEQCKDFEACDRFRCINPCKGACGTGADCKVEEHTPICSCPRGYTGDPFISCRAFTLDDLCRDNPCGSNAECHPGKDRSGNDRPVCTCPRGYIGNPLISCRKGECENHDTCPDHQACYGYMCQSPCVTEVGSVCGLNADCRVNNHTPVCSCPRGYIGEPLQECRISPSARIAGRSHRKQ